MRWVVLSVAALACVVVLWVIVMPAETDPVVPPPTERAPTKFDTQGGQEMRPQWNRR